MSSWASLTGARAARWVRGVRRRLGWSLERLAFVLGCPLSTIEGFEAGAKICPLWRMRLEVLSRRPRAPALPAKIKTLREAARREIRARLNGRRVVASVSGGKDSAAMSLYLHELGIDHERVFLDTGWEAPATYQYLKGELVRVLGPIKWVKAPRQMEELIRDKGMFPGRRIRFCTQELKVLPMIKHLRGLMDAGHDVVNSVGIRAAESLERSRLPEWEYQDGFDCDVWRPLLTWSEAEVIAIHRRHGLKPNPLYLLGVFRVGCWPCIYARKSEIRLIADIDPERIDRMRTLEQEVGERATARAARDGRELKGLPSWFQNRLSTLRPDGTRDGSCWPIDRVVEWSRTGFRGGEPLSQEEFLLSSQTDGCMRWGLCEISAAAQ